MGIKDDNTRRVRELEEELSEERIAELFLLGDENFYKTAEKIQRRRKAAFRSIVVFVALIISILIVRIFFSFNIVDKTSMMDTIAPRDCMILAQKAYDFSEIEFVDIIIFESQIIYEEGRTQTLVKRVIGLPGDEIEIKGQNVFRNGIRLDEPYTKDGVTEGTQAQIKVPEGCIYVLGDNRQASVDSRDARVGYVEKENIRGKVIFRILPLSKAGLVR